jgi:hypothetical protein
VLSSVFLEFHDRVAWDLAALSRDWALGLSQNNSVPVMSKVGIMSSLRFQQLMSPLITNKLGSYFRLMMHTSSIIYSLGPQDSYCGIPPDDFYSLRSHAGTRVLVGLERLIRPTELANASPEKLRAIFLLLFGTILAVLYNEREEDSTAIMVSAAVKNLFHIASNKKNSYFRTQFSASVLESSPNFKINWY